MEKINIAEILKDCQKGAKLYSPLCGECYFDRLNMGTIICKKQNTHEITFTREGYYLLPVFDDCECVLFPSKENRNWNTFQRPFNRGDIIYTCCNSGHEYISIFNEYINDIIHVFVTISDYQKFCTSSPLCYFPTDVKVSRLATKEEIQKLFDAIKANGYKWNDETKTLEKLIEPKFKVGDKIKHKSLESYYTVESIDGDTYVLTNGCKLQIRLQDAYELVPNKFDISTLKPFESKVLMRESNNDCWRPAIYGYKNSINKRFYAIAGGTYQQCIPYEDNEHLLGTTNDCDEYYKTW